MDLRKQIGEKNTKKMYNVFLWFKLISSINNLRELAPPLTPEDPSREAYWVANGNRRRAGTR